MRLMCRFWAVSPAVGWVLVWLDMVDVFAGVSIVVGVGARLWYSVVVVVCRCV